MFLLHRNGKRRDNMVCLSHPDVLGIATEAAKQYFRDHPDALTLGFAPADGFPVCYCDYCMKENAGFTGKGFGIPSISDQWFRFANAIAEEVSKEFPDKWLLTNGYANRVRLPERLPSMNRNLGIQTAYNEGCGIHRLGDPNCWPRRFYQQLLKRWKQQLDFVFMYDYDPGKSLDGLPYPNLHTIRHDLPFYKEIGLWGFWTEGSNSWMVTHLNYFVRAKLMWDTTEDVDALVREYCQLFYGSAADPVEKYIWTLESAFEDTVHHTCWGRPITWRVILDPVIADLNELISEAEALATDTESAQRVRLLRLTHNHMNAFVALQNAADDGDYSGACAWADRMLAMRDEAGAMQSGMLPHTPEWAQSTETTLEWYKKLYAGFATMVGGSRGELIAHLPRTWNFKKDPHDIGVIYQWYLPEDAEGWEPIDSTLPWEFQGHVEEGGIGYSGKAWYRTQFHVPADAAGKPLTLTIGGIYSGADYNRSIWIWVNGRMVDFAVQRRYRLGYYHDLQEPVHIDVTNEVRPGDTATIAVLVHTRPMVHTPRGGIHRRAFLWSPKKDAESESN